MPLTSRYSISTRTRTCITSPPTWEVLNNEAYPGRHWTHRFDSAVFGYFRAGGSGSRKIASAAHRHLADIQRRLFRAPIQSAERDQHIHCQIAGAGMDTSNRAEQWRRTYFRNSAGSGWSALLLRSQSRVGD